MNAESSPVNRQESNTQPAADVVHAILRFTRMLRYRSSYVISCIVLACLFGAVYYFTATRVYQAKASLLVLQTGNDVSSPNMTHESHRQTLLPTYVKLFASPIVLDGAVRRLKKMPAEVRVDFVSEPERRWAALIRKNLTAKNVRHTNLIDLAYRSKHPRAAEAVVEAVTAAYLEFMDVNHKDVSKQIVSILDQERRQIETRLEEKQSELLEVKHQVGVYGPSEGSPVVHPTVQRVLSLNQSYLEVLQARIQLQASLAAIQDAVRRGGDLRQHLTAIEPTVGQELILSALGLNPQYTETVNSLERKLIDDRAKLETMIAGGLGEAHPKVRELSRVIHNTEEYVAQSQQRINDRLDRDRDNRIGPMLVSMVQERLAETWAHESELHRQYKQQESEAIQLNDHMARLSLVEHDVRMLTKMYDALSDRIYNIDIQQEQGDIRVAVIGEPTAPNHPVSPQRFLVALVCVIGGLAVGASIVYVVEILDDRFRSPEEMSEQLGLPVLAMVRKLAIGDEKGIDSLQVYTDAKSVESEAFRTLRTTLTFSGRELERLAITSAEPGDGKTTVLANLGVCYAQAGKKTLLIDADLRRPGLTRMMDFRGQQGLSEILRSELEIADDCTSRILSTGIPMLDMLPCGLKPPDPTELLSSSRFSDVIAWAENQYEQILVDCPPVVAASDAAIVGRLVDAVMLVVQPSKNHRRLVMRATESLMSMQVELVGIVGNQVGSDKDRGYYGYGYGYGYGDGYEEAEEGVQSESPQEYSERPLKVVTDAIETPRGVPIRRYPDGDTTRRAA